MNIEDLINVDECKGLQAACITTTAQILAVETCFVKKRFRDDTDENTMEVLLDRGLVRAAKTLSVSKQSNNPMQTTLGDICGLVDKALASIESHGPKYSVEEVFNMPLIAREVAAIRREHPTLQNGCTSDKKMLNIVLEDPCGAEM